MTETPLYLLSCAPEKAMAIDLYSDQHLNVDESGSGDLLKLHSSLVLHADAEPLVVQAGPVWLTVMQSACAVLSCAAKISRPDREG